MTNIVDDDCAVLKIAARSYCMRILKFLKKWRDPDGSRITFDHVAKVLKYETWPSLIRSFFEKWSEELKVSMLT